MQGWCTDYAARPQRAYEGMRLISGYIFLYLKPVCCFMSSLWAHVLDYKFHINCELTLYIIIYWFISYLLCFAYHLLNIEYMTC